MIRPKLVISDVDGTLVRHNKSLSDAVVAAAGRLEQAGIGFTLISARPPSGIRWIGERLRLSLPMGAFNGGTLVTPAGEVIAAHRLAPDVAARALALIDVAGVQPWLFADGRWFARTTDNTHNEREIASAGQQPVLVDDFTPLLDRMDKIVGVADDHPLLARLEGEVATALGIAATVARSQLYYLDVTAPAANKGDGVAALARAAGVELADVMVFGDQRNDLPMFARAGASVAMGQGPDEVRAAATHVAPSNDDDGVAWAIDEVVLRGR